MEAKLSKTAITDKVFELSEQFNNYVFAHPEILDEIPDRAVLVFMDVDDPVFNQANLSLVDSIPFPAGSRRVYVKMSRRVRMVEQIDWQAEIQHSIP